MHYSNNNSELVYHVALTLLVLALIFSRVDRRSIHASSYAVQCQLIYNAFQLSSNTTIELNLIKISTNVYIIVILWYLCLCDL